VAEQETVTVSGSHFLQEDAPEAVGDATARFVAKALAGQIA
jgi:haloalkane dehalogenase